MNFKICQKCGGTQVVGPRYVAGIICGGWLKYTCSQCGWFWYEATKDAPRDASRLRRHWAEEAE